jgi:DNA-binding MarR family transcriptional regulator
MNEENQNHPRVGVGYLVNKTALYFKITVLQLFKEKSFEVTPEQLGILFFLSKEDGMYQRQLAKISLKDRPNITRLIDILEQRNFVYRETDSSNKRIIKVFITESGKNVVEKVYPHLIEINQQATQGISEDELIIFKQVLGKICSNMNENFKLQI